VYLCDHCNLLKVFFGFGIFDKKYLAILNVWNGKNWRSCIWRRDRKKSLKSIFERTISFEEVEKKLKWRNDGLVFFRKFKFKESLNPPAKESLSPSAWLG
jgi:hypothetical protein